MDMSRKGLEFLIQREALRTKAYQDNVGVWTIGVGHTAAAGQPKPKKGMVITKEEAMRILANDLAQYEDAVEKAIKVKMTQNEFDALVSLCFNIGPGAFAKSSVVKAMNSGNKALAANNFRKWNKGRVNGKLQVIRGLTVRREAERAVFLTPYKTSQAPAAFLNLPEILPQVLTPVLTSMIERRTPVAEVKVKAPTQAQVQEAVSAVVQVNAVNGGFRMGRYSKLIAAGVGNALAILLVWLAMQFPTIATCSIGPDGTDACVIFGFTQTQIMGAVMFILNMVFVYKAPQNEPAVPIVVIPETVK